MSLIHSLLSKLVALIIPSALMLVGAVGALALFQGERPGPDDRAIPPRMGRAHVGDDGMFHLTLDVETAAMKTVVLHNLSGREVARLGLRDGEFILQSAASDPRRFFIDLRSSSEPDVMGTRLFTALQNIDLEMRRDGSVEILLKDPTDKVRRSLLVDADGDVIDRPVPVPGPATLRPVPAVAP